MSLRDNPGLASTVDTVLEMLLSARGASPGQEVRVPEDLVVKVVRSAREVFMSQPMLLEVDAPINICGDTHGQFADLLHMLEIGGFPPESNYLFLGDYVDRAKQSIEVITLCLCYKLKYPENFFLLRGNHECSSLNRIYGFYDECKRRYSVKLWRIFTDTFNWMPVAAIVQDKIFCMHGGLSPDLTDLGQVLSLERPTVVPDEGLLCDLLWSDPEPDIPGWGYNARGVSYTFGRDIVADFLAKHGLELICRAHQVVEDGYEFFSSSDGSRKLVTIFSAPNYCGEFDNAGAMMVVNKDLMCSFKVLRPMSHRPSIRAQEERDRDHMDS